MNSVNFKNLTIDDYNFLLMKVSRKKLEIEALRKRLDEVLDVVDRATTIQLKYYENSENEMFYDLENSVCLA